MKIRKETWIKTLIVMAGILTGWVIAGGTCAVIMMITGAILLAFDLHQKRKQKQMIDTLCENIDKVLHQDYSIDIHDYAEGELSMLMNEVHKMTIRLKEQSDALLKDKTYLMDAMADVSHQLKTPLTSVNLILTLLMKEDLSYEQRMDLVSRLNQSMQHIEWLITTLLKISRFDADTVHFQKNQVNVRQLIGDSKEPLAVAMDLKGVRLEIDVDPAVSFLGDAIWTAEALENIIKNCMEHTPEGGLIRIHAAENPIYTLLEISDNGCGIAKEDLPHIFERFYRGKNADSKSVGIGLALSQMIIRQQNGVISIKNQPEAGVLFTIKFYKSVT